ncbi:MAG: flagellar motor switch protein FliN [Gammaproteobacteria bacterium]|nr:flagellar motor switch protein FliN [Gammaproteobacteria bacterium]MDH5594182.1 flagellar motor switch protein FliN [Gammaproteobacteria bacterium]MDH5614586.1 flagellar motor switch protein FliN [Gammaproteobacteria bacterium]
MSEPTDTDNEQQTGDDWADAMSEQESAETAAGESEAGGEEEGLDNPPATTDGDKQEYQRVETQELVDDGKPLTEDENLDLILDIPVTISMEIGRSHINIRNLLQLNQGSVIELDRLAGEPMDVLVNGTLIAHGEVVVVNEKFGIRLTDVISPAERIKKLK